MNELHDTQRRAPLPTVVLGGWLGAGKTTLLNRWLREASGLRLAVLVNDFGEVSIDADLIVEADGGVDGDVISLAGGCICCAVGGDLFGALRRMTERLPRPDLLLVETSGVALPAAVARTVRLVPGIEVRAVVVLVDGQAWQAQLRDRWVADTVRQQVMEADLLVLTKLDVVDQDREPAAVAQPQGAGSHPGAAADACAASLRRCLAAIAPHAPVLDAQADAAVLRGAVLEADALVSCAAAAHAERVHRQPLHPASVDLPASKPGLWPGSGPQAHAGTLHPVASTLAPAASRYESRLETFDHPVDPQVLIARWAAEGAALVRAKGWVTGLDGRRWRIQRVGARTTLMVDDRAPAQDRVVVIRVRADPWSPREDLAAGVVV